MGMQLRYHDTGSVFIRVLWPGESVSCPAVSRVHIEGRPQTLASAFRFPNTESGVDVLATALPCAGTDVVTSA